MAAASLDDIGNKNSDNELDLLGNRSNQPTRGPNRLVTYKQASAVLAGLDDGLAGEGVQAGSATLLGLGIARAGEKGGK